MHMAWESPACAGLSGSRSVNRPVRTHPGSRRAASAVRWQRENGGRTPVGVAPLVSGFHADRVQLQGCRRSAGLQDGAEPRPAPLQRASRAARRIEARRRGSRTPSHREIRVGPSHWAAPELCMQPPRRFVRGCPRRNHRHRAKRHAPCVAPYAVSLSISSSRDGHVRWLRRLASPTSRVTAETPRRPAGTWSAVYRATSAATRWTRGTPKSKCSVWKSRLSGPPAGGNAKSPITLSGGRSRADQHSSMTRRASPKASPAERKPPRIQTNPSSRSNTVTRPLSRLERVGAGVAALGADGEPVEVELPAEPVVVCHGRRGERAVGEAKAGPGAIGFQFDHDHRRSGWYG